MQAEEIVVSLTALAHASRLAVFRLLVQAGPDGMPAGKIAEALEIPASSLSFHLKELVHAGMILQKQEGRFVIYSAHFAQMRSVLSFLTENCCNGKAC